MTGLAASWAVNVALIAVFVTVAVLLVVDVVARGLDGCERDAEALPRDAYRARDDYTRGDAAADRGLDAAEALARRAQKIRQEDGPS